MPIRPSSELHALCAAVWVAEKLKVGFSAVMFPRALAIETNEMPTFACTTWLLVVSKVTYPLLALACGVTAFDFAAALFDVALFDGTVPCSVGWLACSAAFGEAVLPMTVGLFRLAVAAAVPLLLNERSKTMSKYSVYVALAPQK